MNKPGLRCDFRTREVHLSACSFVDPSHAIQMFRAIIRETERFQRALNDGIKTEADYRVWAAAEEAPPSLKVVGG